MCITYPRRKTASKSLQFKHATPEGAGAGAGEDSGCCCEEEAAGSYFLQGQQKTVKTSTNVEDDDNGVSSGLMILVILADGVHSWAGVLRETTERQ